MAEPQPPQGGSGPRGLEPSGAGVLLCLMRVPLNPGPALQGGVRMVPGQPAPQHLSTVRACEPDPLGPATKPGPSPRTIPLDPRGGGGAGGPGLTPPGPLDSAWRLFSC